MPQEKHVAVVLTALNDFERSHIRPDRLPFGPLAKTLLDRVGEPDIIKKCQEASLLLGTTRTKSARRSALAIIVYSSTLFASLASAQASNSYPVYTPHTIALRELYYWLIPAIILSSAAGAFPTEWTAWKALEPVAQTLHPGDRAFNLEPLKPWIGAIYIWRPSKVQSGRSYWWLLVACLSVGLAYITAFCTSWFTPTVGFGCRAWTELGYFLAWLFSVAFTSLFSFFLAENWPRLLFGIVYVKDILLAVPMTLVLYLAFQGAAIRLPSLFITMLKFRWKDIKSFTLR
jgi:hypothetical protein